MSYRRGASFECEIRDLLEARGSLVARAAGSKGKSGADLFELTPQGTARLVQCKHAKTAWSGFGPAERAKLLTAATSVHATAVLVWRPTGTSRIVWIPPESWPNVRP